MFDLLALQALLPSVISSFLPKIRRPQAPKAPPLDLPLQVVEIICTQSSTATHFQRKISKVSWCILSISYSVIFLTLFIHAVHAISQTFECLPMLHQSKLTHLTDTGAPYREDICLQTLFLLLKC